jgi:hypothetical protein
MEVSTEYKEGDIVNVPYGMRIVRQGPEGVQGPKKSWLTGFAEKREKKKYKEEGEEVTGEEGYDEGGEIDEGGDDDLDGGDDEGGEGGEEGGEGGEGEEDGPGDGEEGEVLPRGKPQGTEYEVQDEWMYKKVPIFTTSAAEKLASDMGLPTHHEKLIKVNIRRRVEAVQITHAGMQRMVVGKNGRLLPAIGGERMISTFDESILDSRSSRPGLQGEGKTPPAFRPKPRSQEDRNPYNDVYNIGTYVKFERGDPRSGSMEMEGIVIAYTETSVGVAVKKDTGSSIDITSDTIFVDYDNVSLKKVMPPKKKKFVLKTMLTPDDVYAATEIPDEIRKMVIDTYISILNELRRTPDTGAGGQGGAIAPVTPSNTKDTLRKIMLKEKPLPPTEWKNYYADEFFKWNKNKHHEFFISRVDVQKVAAIADDLIKQDYGSDALLRQIMFSLPGETLNVDTMVINILDPLSKVKNVTIFQAMVIQSLEKEKYSGRGETKGSDLATLLSNIIQTYYRMHPPDMNAYYKRVYDLELAKIQDDYFPTANDRREFEGLHLVTLRNIYDDMINKYQSEKAKYEDEVRAAELLQKVEAIEGGSPEPPKSPFREIKISLKQNLVFENKKQVERFEQLIFATYGSSVHSYLSGVMLPHIFLEGPLAHHAYFFRAKIANGAFPFSALVGANIAHYLPEFAMNRNLTDEQWLKAGTIIGAVLHNDIAAVVDTYANILNPTAKIQRSSDTYQNISSLVENLEKMLVDPISECQADTSTGYRPVISNDRYVLHPKTRQILEERIPDEDLAICYDPTTKAFTCHSTRDVMLSIARGDLANPHTKKPYPEDFVKRIRDRSETIISKMKLPGSPLPLVEPVPIPPSSTAKKTPKPQVLSLPPSKAVKTRKRHIAPKKGSFEVITKMLLLGDIERLALFDESIIFDVDEGGEIMEEEVAITFDVKDKNVDVSRSRSQIEDVSRSRSQIEDVAVLTFYADEPDSIKDLSQQAKKIPKRIKKIYVAGLNALKVSAKDRVLMAAKIKKLVHAKNVFYVDHNEDDDLKDVLIDVTVDVEGIKAV